MAPDQQELMLLCRVGAFLKRFACSITGQELFKPCLGLGEFMMLFF